MPSYNHVAQPPPSAIIPTDPVAAGGSIPAGLTGKWEPLYDRQVIAAGALPTTPLLNFFALGTGGAASRDDRDTNVATAGALEAGSVFDVYGFALTIITNEEPVLRFLQQSLYAFNLGDSPRWRQLAIHVPGLGGVSGIGIAAAPFLNNGAPLSENYMHLPVGMVVPADVPDPDGRTHPDGSPVMVPGVQTKDFRETIIAEQPFGVELQQRRVGAPVNVNEVVLICSLIGERIDNIDYSG